MNKVIHEIKDIIEEGLRNEIFRAERAIAIYQEIAQNSDEINRGSEHPKRVLGYLQKLTISEAVLATTKLYDPVGKYPTRSIHLLLNLLEEKADKFPKVIQKLNTKMEMEQLNVPNYIISKVDLEDSSQFPKHLSQFYRSLVYDSEVEKLLNEVKNFRDKRVAHNERTKKNLSFNWNSIKQLLEFPKQIVGIIGWAYLNTVYMHNNEYRLSFNATTLTASIRGLIKQEN